MLLRLLCSGLLLSACASPMHSSRQLVESARESSVAARFGQLDMAARYADSDARAGFLERRTAWGKDVRVVDVEVSGVNPEDDERAEVTVNVSWTRVDEGLLRNSTILQDWANTDRGWRITGERHVDGDSGLFGEPMPQVGTPPAGDVHLPTRSLGAVQH